MTVKVYERILDLFEAEGISTIFGIPDPNFVHLFHLADERGWTVVAPRHEEAAGFMAEAVSRMTGQAAVCIGTLGPGLANLAGAMMCAKVENSPVIFLGGQRARITEQRVRRGRIQFVQQARLLEPSVKYCASIEYADQTDEIIREAPAPGPVRHAGPGVHRVPRRTSSRPSSTCPRRCRRAPTVSSSQTAGPDKIAEAAAAISAARQPILLVGHAVHTHPGRGLGQGARRRDGLPGHPDLRRHLVHRRARGPHVPLRILAVGGRRGGAVRPVPRHRHRAGRAGPLRQGPALGPERGQPQVDL